MVEDPLFHQRYAFHRNGDVLRVEMWTEPGGGVTMPHVHPRLEERYEVLEGEITFTVGRRKRVARAGERLVVAPGTRHAFRNTGADVAHLVAEAEPALTLQESIEEGAAMARAGLLTKGGRPKGWRAMREAAAFSLRHRETTVLLSPPPFLQRLLSPLIAPRD